MAIRPIDHGVIALSGAAGGMTYSTTGSPTLRTYSTYSSLTWTGSGTFVLLTNPNSLTFDYMLVAGGGAGGTGTGSSTNNRGCGGGGGGGGTRVFTGQAVSIASHTITIGAGGTAAWSVAGDTAASGTTTSFGAVATSGGGGGGNYGEPTSGDGANGGAGGGGSAKNGDGGGLGSGNDGSYSPVEGYSGSSGQWYALIAMATSGSGGGGGTGTGQSNASLYNDGTVGQTNNYITGATISAPYTNAVTSFAGGGGGGQFQDGPAFLRGGTKVYGGGDDLSPRPSVNGGSGYCGAGNAGTHAASSSTGGDGVANSGGGGGGMVPYNQTGTKRGGHGGSGVFVLRWTTE